MIKFIAYIIMFLIICWVVEIKIKINSTPFRSDLPCITFEQFVPIYNVAPEKWKQKIEYDGAFHLEYIAMERNPSYEAELKDYQERRKKAGNSYSSWLISNYLCPPREYTEHVKSFTVLHGERNKFNKFFNDTEKRKQDKKNDEAMMDCLKYWREDARIAQEKAQKELNQAQENFNEIANRLKESGDEVKFIYQMEEIV